LTFHQRPGPAHASALRRCIAALSALCGVVTAMAQRPATPPSEFARLEAAGAHIGQIRVIPQDIFDTRDPKEDKALFRLANRLHIRTRPAVVRRELLFATGQPLVARRIEETERLLRANRYFYDVQIRPRAVHDGVVDIDVLTRDTWSFDPGISVGRAGGENSSGFQLSEYNLLGGGVAVSLGHSNDVDRSSNEFEVASPRAFGTWVSLAYSHARNSDGRRDAASAVRPFYALDATWAAGVSGAHDDRIDALYNGGNVASQYRHRSTQAEMFGGWSAGRVEGWVQRYSLGLSLQDDAFAAEPGLAAPPQLPIDQRLVSPFVRYERLEDHYQTELNRNLIGRPEFFALGWAASAQLGWASTALGSSQNTLLYSGSVNRGFQLPADRMLTTSLSLHGQWFDGRVQRLQVGAGARYYVPQSPRWLFYAAASGDALARPQPQDALLLGGDNGLRGYPLRYQSGDRRVLFTLEERFYTDIYLWRLFRIGGALFVDAGRAWGGQNTNLGDPGWLGDAGFGLRFVSARSAFSNVLHVDIAFPVHAAPDIRKLQFLVRTRASF